jgi:hypothetical protein
MVAKTNIEVLRVVPKFSMEAATFIKAWDLIALPYRSAA